MGLLDDAIREHLELKRKHGASDEEINQKEAEALGPARRGFPVQQAEPAEAADATEVAEAPAEPAEAPAAPFDAAAEPLEPPAFDPVAEEPTAVEPPPPVEEPEPAEEPEPTDEHMAAEEEPSGEDEPQGDEDVLEETPEFLQDAPEHDRLWFEQKPPRDFDFE
jgi:hypothetical protein